MVRLIALAVLVVLVPSLDARGQGKQGAGPDLSSQVKRTSFASVHPDTIYKYIESISLGWRSESRTRKSESQKQVLFRDTTGRYADVFIEAIEDLNRVFGYQKLVPQLSTTDETKDEAFVVYFGTQTEGRRFLREAGARSRPSTGAWDGWFWWDDSKEMSKAAIAIYREDVTEHSLRFYLRRSVLTALGYPGYTQYSASIFAPYSSRFRNPEDINNHDKAASPFISDWDVAILRFCDRLLSADASRANMRKVISREWRTFALQLDSRQAAAQQPRSGRQAAP